VSDTLTSLLEDLVAYLALKATKDDEARALHDRVFKLKADIRKARDWADGKNEGRFEI
jgi:hypothetical protein